MAWQVPDAQLVGPVPTFKKVSVDLDHRRAGKGLELQCSPPHLDSLTVALSSTALNREGD
jgi:hypothetical protein